MSPMPSQHGHSHPPPKAMKHPPTAVSKVCPKVAVEGQYLILLRPSPVKIFPYPRPVIYSQPDPQPDQGLPDLASHGAPSPLGATRRLDETNPNLPAPASLPGPSARDNPPPVIAERSQQPWVSRPQGQTALIMIVTSAVGKPGPAGIRPEPHHRERSRTAEILP